MPTPTDKPTPTQTTTPLAPYANFPYGFLTLIAGAILLGIAMIPGMDQSVKTLCLATGVPMITVGAQKILQKPLEARIDHVQTVSTETHAAVNHQMEEMKKLIEKAAFARGELKASEAAAVLAKHVHDAAAVTAADAIAAIAAAANQAVDSGTIPIPVEGVIVSTDKTVPPKLVLQAPADFTIIPKETVSAEEVT